MRPEYGRAVTSRASNDGYSNNPPLVEGPIQKAYYLYLDFLKPFKLSACKIDLCKAFKKVFFLDHRH